MSAETARMTLRVYEVNLAGITQIVREKTAVKPLERPEASHEFPPVPVPYLWEPHAVTRCYADGDVRDFPIKDDTGAHCPERGITLLWHVEPPTDSRPAAHSLEGPRPGGRPPTNRRRSP